METRNTRWSDDAIPESVELRVQKAAALTAAAQTEWNDYIDVVAVSLGELRARSEHGAVSVEDNFGTRHRHDLGQWSSEPDSTRVVASFAYRQRSVPAPLRASVYPDDLLDRIGHE